jgi:exosortase
VPVLREGTLLHLPRSAVHVADACSGFNILYGGVVTALILAHLIRSPGRRALLLLAVVPLALLTNAVRVVVLTLIVHYRGTDLLHTSLHPITGVAAFAVALVALFAIAGREVVERRAAAPA